MAGETTYVTHGQPPRPQITHIQPHGQQISHGPPPMVQGLPGSQVTPLQQPVHFSQVPPATPGVNPNYNARAGLWTGWIQVACGVAAILIGIISVVCNTSSSHIGSGIWSGLLFYLTAGILGVQSTKRSYDMIIVYMVMSIICSLVSGICLIISSVGASTEYWWYGYQPVSHGVLLTLDLISVLIALVEFVTSIVAAAFCCSGNCCMPHSAVGTRTVVQYSNVHPNAFMTTIPQGPVAYTTTQHYIPQPHNQAPAFNNFIQPMPMYQYPPQAPYHGQPFMPAQPQAAQAAQPAQPASTNPTLETTVAPPVQGATGEMPPPYEQYGQEKK